MTGASAGGRAEDGSASALRDRLVALALLCSAALLAPLVQPLLAGRVFAYNDLGWFHLPTRFLYQQALRAGDSLLWTPAIFSGFYLHGEGQTGVFHPLHLALYRLLPLTAAFDLELIVNYVAAFIGMAWLLRRMAFSVVATAVGAMLFAFSGFGLLHYHHLNMVAVVAHLPWLLAAADLVIAGDRPGSRRLGAAAVAGLIASGFLIGFPQAMWWNALTLSAFALLRAGETGQWRALIPCAAAVVVGVLIGGIQIVPTADAAARSLRADYAGDFALTFSLHPLNLVQLWSPYAFTEGAYTAVDYLWFHEFGIYSGALLPVALIWVWLRWRALPARRPLIAGATAFAAVMLVLALGRYGGLAALLAHLPVLGSLRAPARYIVLAQFALTLLAAVAIDDLLAIIERRVPASIGWSPMLWTPVGLGLLTLAVLNGQLLTVAGQPFASVASAAAGVAVLAAVTLLVIVAGRGAAWALAALIVVTAADLGAYGVGFVRQERPQSIQQLVQGVPRAPSAIDESYASAPTSGQYRSDLLVLRGYRLTNGYAGLFPAGRRSIDDETNDLFGGARWRFAPHGTRVATRYSVARIRLVDEYEREAAGTARMVVDRPGRLEAQVEVPVPTVVATTERFHDGWTATANGAPVRVVRVAADFLGCEVPAGSQRVELRFAPRSFRTGLLVSLGGLVALGVLLLAWRPKDRLVAAAA